MLERARDQGAVRVWTCDQAAVVLGVSRPLGGEVDEAECDRRAVAVLRRASGGGTVVIGPGTLQYAFALPHPAGAEAVSIDRIKRFCNRAVRDALASSGVGAEIGSDVSGDLHVDLRKVGGIALRRHRHATLLHGTLLVDADLDLIAAVLRHPEREPAWRQGRPHGAFLANLGYFDTDAFERELQLSSGCWPPADDDQAQR
jgi:lipoate-protein ligase A